MEMFSILAILIAIAVPVLILYGLIKVFQAVFHHPDSGRGMTLDDLKRGAVSLSIAILSATFANVMAYSLFPDYQDRGGFVVAFVLSLAILAGGILARSNPVVGNGLLSGGMLSLIFCIGVRFYDFEPITKMIIIGLSLLGVTTFVYLVGMQTDPLTPGKSSLKGFRSFVAGTVMFILAILFAVYTNDALNPKPSYPQYRYIPYSAPVPQYDSGRTTSIAPESVSSSEAMYQAQVREYEQKKSDYERTSVVIVFILALAYLVVGLLVHAIVPVSAAYVLAGVVSIIFVLIQSFERLGAPTITGLTGVGLFILIGLAYWKFGGATHKEDQSHLISTNTPLETPPTLPQTPSENPPSE